MATMRTVINYVLRAIAEDEVGAVETSLSTDYHKLVAVFLNQFKEEIEDAHNWRDLQQTHTATILASASTGAIVNANERSRLLRVNTDVGLAPLVYDVTLATTPFPLIERPLAEIRMRILQDVPGTATEPSMFAIEGNADGTLDLVVYPKPTTQRTIQVVMITPQARLADTDLDVQIKIPFRPLEMGTIWYALEERGEEVGQNAMFTEERFRKALDDAIARDADEQGGYQLQIV